MIHLGVIHAGVIHALHLGRAFRAAAMVHAHIGHGQQRRIAQSGHRRSRAGGGSKRGDCHAGPVHGFRHDGVGGQRAGLHQHIIGLGHANLQLVHLHGPHILSVGGHHRHRQTGDAQVEEGHRRPVDDAQPHPLARRKGIFHAFLRAVTIGQIGIGGAGHVQYVRRHHAHARPHSALIAALIIIIGGRGLLIVEIALPLFQLGHDGVRMARGKFAQQQHIVALCRHRIGALGIDHDRPIMAGLFLQAGMAVPPIGAGLADRRQIIGEGFAGLDAGKADAGHAVILKRHQDSVPMDRTVLVQMVGHVDLDRLPFGQAHQRAGHAAIHGNAVAGTALHHAVSLADTKIDDRPAYLVEARAQHAAACQIAATRPGRRGQSGATQSGAAQQISARDDHRHGT